MNEVMIWVQFSLFVSIGRGSALKGNVLHQLPLLYLQ